MNNVQNMTACNGDCGCQACECREFKGRVVFVTGAGSGIGRATAQEFARRGAQTVLVGRKQAPLQEVAQTIVDAGGVEPLVIADCDVSDEAAVEKALSDTFEKFGRLDIAFNNAGIVGALGLMGDIDSAEYLRLMNINVNGVFYSMKHQIPLMLKTLEKFKQDAGSGGQCRIINTSSCAGLIGFKGAGAYVASKFAVNGLTKNAALDYADAGIAVNAVNPGPIKTPLIGEFTGNTDEGTEHLLTTVPLRRYGTPEGVAKLVVSMCNPKMTFMTGATVSIDGGQTAGY